MPAWILEPRIVIKLTLDEARALKTELTALADRITKDDGSQLMAIYCAIDDAIDKAK